MTTELLAADLRRAWATQIRKTASQPYLLALLLGSLFLSAASFYTTFVGMNSFAPNPFVNFCIVFAIQALLFVTSWRVGFAMADREALPVFTIFVFLICLATSVFFSWVALFGTINTDQQQELTRVTRAHRAVDNGNTELVLRAAEQQRVQIAAFLESPAYLTWAGNFRQVSNDALSARDSIEARREDAAATAAQRLRSLEAERSRLLSEDAARTERAASAEQELERLNERRPELAARVDRLRVAFETAEEAVVVQEGRMEAEERGGAGGAGTGRGPIWRGLRDQRNILAAERDTQRRLFEASRGELDRTDARITQLTADVAAARAASTAGEVAAIETRIEQTRGSDGLTGGVGGADLDAAVETMAADLALFQTRGDLEAFDRAAAACAGLIDTMTTIGVRTASCDRAELAELLDPIRQTQQGRAALAARCAPGGESALDIASLSFAQAVAYGRECVAISQLPVETTDDVRGEFDRLVIEEDPAATDFVKTLNAWREGDKLSYLALSIALFIDALVLFSGLIGALSGSGALRRVMGWRTAQKTLDDFKASLAVFDDPQSTARRILGLVEPYHGPWSIDGARTVGMIDLRKYQGRDRDMIRAFLTERPKMATAEPNPKKPLFGGKKKDGESNNTERFLISDVLTRALRAIASGGEEISTTGNTTGDGVAAHLPRSVRRETAAVILTQIQPYEPAGRGAKDERAFVGQVRLADVVAKTEEGAERDAATERARQLLFGLYAVGLARGYVVDADEAPASRYYVTRKGRDQLEERARAGEAARQSGALEGLSGERIDVSANGRQHATARVSTPLERKILNEMEPMGAVVEQLRRGVRVSPAVGYVDVKRLGDARDEARRLLNQLHFDGVARREELAASASEAPAYLLRLGAVEELKRLAHGHGADAAWEAEAAATAQIPAEPRPLAIEDQTGATEERPAGRQLGPTEGRDAGFDEVPQDESDISADEAGEAAVAEEARRRADEAAGYVDADEARRQDDFARQFLETARRPRPRAGGETRRAPRN